MSWMQRDRWLYKLTLRRNQTIARPCKWLEHADHSLRSDTKRAVSDDSTTKLASLSQVSLTH